MKTLNKIKDRWNKENKEIKALPRLLIIIISMFLAIIISSIFMAITGSFIGAGLFFIFPYLVFKLIFEKLVIKIKK